MNIKISKDRSGDIYIMQENEEKGPDIILLTEDQTEKLAHRLMSLANGQGPVGTEVIDAAGQIIK